MAALGTMRDRVCLVTGASYGIGLETARGLAWAGARVGLVGRNPARTEAAAASIRAQGGTADVFVADLSSQAEVRRLAAAVRERYPRLDVLVNNAGAIFGERHLTTDGLERTWALDHLGYVLLTLELLDLLKASAPARIVNVASAAHTRGRIPLDGDEGAYGAMKMYSAAKLGNVLFTYALARRLAGTGVTVNALHPGVIASGFASETGGLFGFGWRLIKPMLSSPEDGAKTSLHVATAPELATVSGRYFSRSREIASSALSRDHDLQERVWDMSLRQLGLAR